MCPRLHVLVFIHRRITGDAMAENGQTSVAWEMLSSVVAMRAKARENKLPKLLSSLHGVEIELARIIAGADTPNGFSEKSIPGGPSPVVNGFAERPVELLSPSHDVELRADTVFKSRSARRTGSGSRSDQQLRAQAKRYLAIAKQLKELVDRGEAVATGNDFDDSLENDWESSTDALLAEQHDLSFTIAGLKATTFEGLVDKATVLDDLVEENTDDPVQMLARSLARDVMAMGQNGKSAR